MISGTDISGIGAPGAFPTLNGFTGFSPVCLMGVFLTLTSVCGFSLVCLTGVLLIGVDGITSA